MFQKYHYHQLSTSDNAVMCLRSILAFNGRSVSLQKLRDISCCAYKNVTYLDILNTAREVGLQAKGFKTDIRFLEDNNRICILPMVGQRRKHTYVVHYGKYNGKHWIGNPEWENVRALEPEDLAHLWKSGFVLAFEKQQAPANCKDDRISFGQWCRQLFQPAENILATILSLSLASAAVLASMVVVLASLVDTMMMPSGSYGLLLGLFIACWAVYMGLANFRKFVVLRQVQMLGKRFYEYCYNTLASRSSAFFARQKREQVVAGFRFWSEQQTSLVRLFNLAFSLPALMLVSWTMMIVYSWTMATVYLLGILCTAMLVQRHAKIVMQEQEKLFAQEKNIAIRLSEFAQRDAGVSLSAPWFSLRSTTACLVENIQKEKLNYNWLNISRSFSIQFILFALCLLTGLSLFFDLQAAVISAGEGATIVFCGVVIIYAIQQLNDNIEEALSAFRELFNLYDWAEDATDKSNIVRGQFAINGVNDFSLEGVEISTPARNPLLENISLRLSRGERIMLQTPNEKSQCLLADVLFGNKLLYNGSIKVNGVDHQAVSIDSWQQQVGIVPRSVTLFAGNLIENISLGYAMDETPALLGFLRKYGFESYFKQLPQGLKAVVGLSENSVPAQLLPLIALARALWRKPGLLIIEDVRPFMEGELAVWFDQLLKNLQQHMAVICLSRQPVDHSGFNRYYQLKEKGAVLLSDIRSNEKIA